MRRLGQGEIQREISVNSDGGRNPLLTLGLYIHDEHNEHA